MLKLCLSRAAVFGMLILIQLVAIIGLIWGLGKTYTDLYIILELLSFVIAVAIVNGNRNPSYKLAWLLAMLTFPLFGSMFYLFFGIRHSNTKSKKRRQKHKAKCYQYLNFNVNVANKIKELDLHVYRHSKYISDFSYYPPYVNSFCQYLSPGERKYEKLMDELHKAKKFIFLEYFIIKEGFMWNSILDVLEKKANEGVDVRVIYDDVGCLFDLPSAYFKTLAAKGIKCKIFNPVVPFINIYMNHRDHRKIAVIDGNVAFTGGTNLADEYINKDNRLGHWKDSDLMVKGEAVWSFTVLFLQMWNFFKDYDDDWNKFKGTEKDEQVVQDGYIQPFGDIPIDDENVYENTYINLINSAKRYVYIITPYLIIDNEILETLVLAAKSGVDVRIICPGVPDKKMVYLVTSAFFKKLVKAGVKIYLYKPGFIHSKLAVVDDQVGIVGTANLDYRSFYLHFECGVWMYKSKVLLDIKDDFIETQNKSELVTLEHLHEVNIFTRIFQSILRIFSPML